MRKRAEHQRTEARVDAATKELTRKLDVRSQVDQLKLKLLNKKSLASHTFVSGSLDVEEPTTVMSNSIDLDLLNIPVAAITMTPDLTRSVFLSKNIFLNEFFSIL